MKPRPLTKHERKVLDDVYAAACRGWAYMPTAVADRKAALRLARRGALECTEARHVDTGSEGRAYVVALRPLFNVCVQLCMRDIDLTNLNGWQQPDFFARRHVARIWRAVRSGERAPSPRPIMTPEGMALWHAVAAAHARLDGAEDRVLAHGAAVAMFRRALT